MMMVKAMGMANEKYNNVIYTLVLLHEKFLQFDWLREVVFQALFEIHVPTCKNYKPFVGSSINKE